MRNIEAVANVSNFLKHDMPGSMPMDNFVRLLDSVGLEDENGVLEVSRFCILVKDDISKHYTNHLDNQGNNIFPSKKMVDFQRQVLKISGA